MMVSHMWLICSQKFFKLISVFKNFQKAEAIFFRLGIIHLVHTIFFLKTNISNHLIRTGEFTCQGYKLQVFWKVFCTSKMDEYILKNNPFRLRVTTHIYLKTLFFHKVIQIENLTNINMK